MDEKEGEELESSLRKLAEEWRNRLEQPELKEALRTGRAVLSPLVKELLDAFP